MSISLLHRDHQRAEHEHRVTAEVQKSIGNARKHLREAEERLDNDLKSSVPGFRRKLTKLRSDLMGLWNDSESIRDRAHGRARELEERFVGALHDLRKKEEK